MNGWWRVPVSTCSSQAEPPHATSALLMCYKLQQWHWDSICQYCGDAAATININSERSTHSPSAPSIHKLKFSSRRTFDAVVSKESRALFLQNNKTQLHCSELTVRLLADVQALLTEEDMSKQHNKKTSSIIFWTVFWLLKKAKNFASKQGVH